MFLDEPEVANSASSARRRSVRSILAHNFKLGIAIAIGNAGEYARAARQIQSVLDQYPQVTWAYRQLAAYQALAGDLASARRAVELLLAAHPNVSVAVMNTHHPGRHLPRLVGCCWKGGGWLACRRARGVVLGPLAVSTVQTVSLTVINGLGTPHRKRPSSPSRR